MLQAYYRTCLMIILILTAGCNTAPQRVDQNTERHHVPSSLNGATDAPDERIIVYAGFGLLHTEAQPEFTKLWKANTQNTRQLRAQLERSAINTVHTATLPISSYPVAVTNDDVLNILEHRLGERPPWVRFQDIDRAFSKVYLLVVTAGLEMHAAVPYRARGFEQYGHHFIAGASAMLVEMGGEVGDSRVVLSTTALHEIEERRAEQQISSSDRAEQFANAYEKAAVTAIQDLLNLAQKHGQNAVGELSERSIVTSVIVDDEMSRQLFNFEPVKADTSCRISTPCQAGGDGCALLSSLIAHKTTEVLGHRGHIMLPPLRWAVWGGLAGERAAVTLSLSRGIDAIEESLQINVSERSADEKIASILNGVTHADYAMKGTDKMFYRAHIASLSLCRYRTDTLNTNRVLQRKIEGPINNVGHENQELRVSGELSNPLDVERAFKLISVWDALENYK
jgi:hypothetical protein